MTPWRLEQLWRTYLVAHRELTRELETSRIHAEPADVKTSWLEGFPTRYVRTHRAADIDRHMLLADKAKYANVATQVVRQNGVWELTVVTTDRPGLFARLAGSLAAFGMNIVKAEAFSNASGVVLDTFAFEDPMRTLELNAAEIERLQSTISKVVLDREDVSRLLRGRPRREAPSSRARVRPTVAFDNNASESATLVEIVAHDRPGLLYDLANTFSSGGCSIEVVLIDTEVHKAIDVFYVTSNGAKLGEPSQSLLREQLLKVCQQ
jgi:[protein-PII] uridylyltransferase